jgi:hypothetical protein
MIIPCAMFHSAKCPYCERTITSARVETITIDGGIGSDTEYKGVTYSCPACRKILTVSMDQIALNADLVTRITKALRKG